MSLRIHWNLADVLNASDYSVGCPVFAGAFSLDPEIQAAAGAAFDSWRGILIGALGRTGDLSDERIGTLASVMISAVEGALARCRVEQSTGPLDEVERILLAALA